MAEEKKQNTKPKKKKGKVDTPSLIFFGIMIIGLVVLTVIIFTRPSSKIYSVQYGDNFIVSVEMYSNNKVDLAVDVGTERVLQSGTYTEITDDDIENNYLAEFEAEEDGGEPIKVTILIADDELTMTYEDGSNIILKETK